MSRRPHKKSRTGCSGCKTRHVKCDETRPLCINCQTADFPCSFANESGNAAISRTASPRPQTKTGSPASFDTEDRSVYEGSAHAQLSVGSNVNMDHLNLFSHFQTETIRSLGSRKAGLEGSYKMMVDCGLSTPYLMHEMLAIAALHISILIPDEENSRRRQATELQQVALGQFDYSNFEVTEASCIPMFLFSSLLGIHILCDTLRYRDEDLNKFLDSFTYWLKLHRGVRSITTESWHVLLRTELAPFLKTNEVMATNSGRNGQECSRLRALIHSSELPTSSKEVYDEAIEHLQSLFNSQEIMGPKDSVQTVFHWPIIVSPQYAVLLSQRRPEALIILAHYAMLLHVHRWLWVIGDGGEFLIKSISESLGSPWVSWLEFPLSVLEEDQRELLGSVNLQKARDTESH